MDVWASLGLHCVLLGQLIMMMMPLYFLFGSNLKSALLSALGIGI